ncbi:MAG: hypothetical protein IH616_03605, partial [Gemmatimonadales bacterium]|nr:hypothetical protein [Gemmatimonadales bacterium]
MPTFVYRRYRPLAALGAAVLLAFVAFLGACQDDGGPTGAQGDITPPLEAKSDGTDVGGNPGIFFLPPVVADPSGHENFDVGGFNPDLEPWVEICELEDVGAGLPTSGTECADGVTGWPHTFAFGAADGVRLVPDEEHYQVEWHTDAFDLNSDRFYRIFVYLPRMKPTDPAEGNRLGFVDVNPVTAREMKSAKTGEVFALKDGRTLPIKFRIEKDWVCGAGAEDCFAEVIDAATGGTVVNEMGDLVYVPPQDGGVFHVLGPDGSPTTAEQITVSMRYCAAPGLLPIDLPQYGDCLDNQAQPLLDPNWEPGLSPMAVVAMCSVDGTDPFGLGDQAPLVTMHRWDNNLEGGQVYALPHADWECAPVIGLAEPGGLFGLASRGWNTVRDGLAKLIAPRPLFANAPLMMHRGPAGPTEFFSWFMMALPATMEILEGDGQAATVGSAVPIPPKVKVTDLHGGLVNGATITFTPSGAGAADPVTVVTGEAGEDGIAQTTWTLGDLGLNLLTASGRGIADPVNNGPRVPTEVEDGFDPFQPLDHDFDGTDGPAVTLQTGEVVFSAGGTQVGALCTENDLRCTQQVVVAGDPDTLVIESSGDLVFIPEQEGGFVVEDGQGGTTVVRAITVVAELCQLPDTALPIDLPQFGNCLDIRSEPQLSMDPQNPGLSDPAIVAMCSAEDPTFGLAAEQWPYLTLHRYDEGHPVVALPHASWECPPDPIPVEGHGGWLGFASRGWNSLAKQFAPRPLFADARPVMHRGPAGPTEFFSWFRMALPAKMEALEGDGQLALLGTAVDTAPAVLVTDLGDNPVSGARVTFTPSADASVDPVTVWTGSDGIARVTEFRVGTSVGDYTLTASGRGIADAVNN